MRRKVLKDVVSCHWSLTTRALSTMSDAKFCVHVVEQATVSGPQAEDLDLFPSSQQMESVFWVVFGVLEEPLFSLLCLDDCLDFIV